MKTIEERLNELEYRQGYGARFEEEQRSKKESEYLCLMSYIYKNNFINDLIYLLPILTQIEVLSNDFYDKDLRRSEKRKLIRDIDSLRLEADEIYTKLNANKYDDGKFIAYDIKLKCNINEYHTHFDVKLTNYRDIMFIIDNYKKLTEDDISFIESNDISFIESNDIKWY